VALAHWLSGSDFGAYRVLWLVAGTAVALLPLSVPTSLFYFGPRSSKDSERARWFTQAGGFMLATGLLAALLVRYAGEFAGLLTQHLWTAAGFVGLWVLGSLLDVIYSSRQRGEDQALINLGFVVLRTGLVLGTAYLTRSFGLVLLVHLIVAAIKAGTCAVLLQDLGARPKLLRDRRSWSEQLRYAVPLGVASGLFVLSSRIDQWLVAARFSVAQYGLYSIAALFVPIQGLVRSTVNAVLLPEINRLHGESDHTLMLQVNNRGNVGVALLMFPILAFLVAAAEPLFELLFPREYADAALILRVYVVRLVLETVEVGTLMMALGQVRYMVVVDAVALLLGLVVSIAGAEWIGLWGTALGNVAAIIGAQLLSYRRCAALLRRPIGRMQPWYELGKILLAALVAGLVSVGIFGALPMPPDSLLHRLSEIVVTALSVAVVYLLVLRMLAVDSAKLLFRWLSSRNESQAG
jgi:O-antigen/teichoic acid export membrane protein